MKEIDALQKLYDTTLNPASSADYRRQQEIILGMKIVKLFPAIRAEVLRLEVERDAMARQLAAIREIALEGIRATIATAHDARVRDEEAEECAKEAEHWQARPDGWIVYFAGQLTDQIFDSKVKALNYTTKMSKYGDETRRELRAFYFHPQPADEIERLRTRVAELEKDAGRYLCLTDDHDSLEVRGKIKDILLHISLRSRSATSRDIDSIMEAK